MHPERRRQERHPATGRYIARCRITPLRVWWIPCERCRPGRPCRWGPTRRPHQSRSAPLRSPGRWLRASFRPRRWRSTTPYSPRRPRRPSQPAHASSVRPAHPSAACRPVRTGHTRPSTTRPASSLRCRTDDGHTMPPCRPPAGMRPAAGS